MMVFCTDVLYEIIYHLSHTELLRLCSTNKQIYKKYLNRKTMIWEFLLKRDFTSQQLCSLGLQTPYFKSYPEELYFELLPDPYIVQLDYFETIELKLQEYVIHLIELGELFIRCDDVLYIYFEEIEDYAEYIWTGKSLFFIRLQSYNNQTDFITLQWATCF